MTCAMPTYNPKTLGRYLRNQRESWGLTQAELASNVGLTQKKISRIENGELQDPGFFDIARIAWWFGVLMEHIVHMGEREVAA